MSVHRFHQIPEKYIINLENYFKKKKKTMPILLLVVTGLVTPREESTFLLFQLQKTW